MLELEFNRTTGEIEITATTAEEAFLVGEFGGTLAAGGVDTEYESDGDVPVTLYIPVRDPEDDEDGGRDAAASPLEEFMARWSDGFRSPAPDGDRAAPVAGDGPAAGQAGPPEPADDPTVAALRARAALLESLLHVIAENRGQP